MGVEDKVLGFMKRRMIVRTFLKAFSACFLTGLAAFFLAAVLIPGSQARAETSAWQALQEKIHQAEAGDVITLSEDVIALDGEAMITIAPGKRITLDLNGHTLDRNLTERSSDNGCVLYIQEGAILTLRDSGETAGAVTGGYHTTGGGIQNYGTLIMESGCVTDNTALDSGGGIANYGMMILTGGSVTGNTSLGEGGGIYNQAKAYLTVHGDPVFGNSAPGSPDIANEGTLSFAGGQADGVYKEDMPVLKRFMDQLSVLPAAVIMLGLLLVVWLDNYLSRERKRSMILIIALVFGLILQGWLENRIAPMKGSNALRLPLSVFGYAARPAILALFLSIVKPGGKYLIAWAMVCVNAAVYMTAFFSGIAFQYSSDLLSGGHFVSGPLRHTCTVVSALLFAWLLILTMQQFQLRTKRESWIPFFVTALIAGSVLMDFTVAFYDQPISFLTVGIVISCVFYYIWLHLQFVREHEDGLRAEQRIQIMKTQIQPHFLFNTLNTIRAVYAMNPPLADQTLEKFSKYLRQNLDAMEQPDLIPFSQEMEHTRLYADIETLRFPHIRMEYRIDDEDFVIPALSVQPLVENAIRHGVRGREEGIVSVSSRRDDNCHLVEIRDNGVGFHPDAPKKPGETHIGIENVRSRLEQLCGGSLEIESEVGKGTTVTIRIPISAHGSGKEQTV